MSVAEPFHLKLRRLRLATIDPKTGRPFSQRRLSAFMLLHKNAIYNYESGANIPHALIRRELERFFPTLFSAECPEER